MKADETNFSPLIKKLENGDPIDLHQTLRKFIYNWRLFLFSVFFCLIGSIVYIKFAKPKYKIKATLIIPTEKESNGQKSSLQELEIYHYAQYVENEIEILKSRDIISQVVNDLNLWIRYHKKDGFKQHELYADSPIQFIPIDLSGKLEELDLEVTIKNQNTFILKTQEGKLKEHRFNQKISSRFGSWMLLLSQNNNDNTVLPINISLTQPETITDTYQKALEVSLLNKNAAVVGISLFDEVEQRGKDFLSSLIEKYYCRPRTKVS